MNESEFMVYMRKVLIAGLKLKDVMLKKGLTKARAHCPICNRLKLNDGGFIYGALIGPKKHLHMACNKCDARMME